MDRTRRQTKLEKRLLKRAQRKLNRLIDLMSAFQAQSQNRDQEPVEMEDMFPNNLTGFFTKGMSLGAPGFLTTTPGAQTIEDVTPTSQTEQESHEEICRDIRGRDRVCCNTAVTCFDDLTSTLDDLSNAKNDFSLLSACRVVGSELKKDKRCVSNALSRCSGPGRALMHRRLDKRLDSLYDQFYKHCRKNPFPRTSPPTTSTTTINATTVTEAGHKPSSHIPDIFTTTNIGQTGTSGNHHTTNQRPPLIESESSAEYGAIIAGALTGGVILLIILIIAAVLWCRNRNENLGSDSSAGIIFYKPKHTPRQMPENNNKPPLSRQESDDYAEIDERLVNPNVRPSLPPQLTNVGYINPVGEGQSVNYFQPEPYNGAPLATTRGQLSYGAILASNTASPSGGATFYHSSPVIDSNFSNGNIHNSETLLSPRRFMSQHKVESHPNSYVVSDSYEDLEQDEYEQPISASSSLRYTELDKNDTPDQIAPSPPVDKTIEHTEPKPSRPANPTESPAVSLPGASQPVPSPRRTKKSNSNDEESIKASSPAENKIQLGPRDSSMSETSTKSSHHYFVLEPGSDKIEYENSVSSPKLV